MPREFEKSSDMSGGIDKSVVSSTLSQSTTPSKPQTLKRIAIADFKIQELIIDSYYSRRQASNQVMDIPLLLV
jgi:hypothetical protein